MKNAMLLYANTCDDGLHHVWRMYTRGVRRK